jgi:hypothetical protein
LIKIKARCHKELETEKKKKDIIMDGLKKSDDEHTNFEKDVFRSYFLFLSSSAALFILFIQQQHTRIEKYVRF